MIVFWMIALAVFVGIELATVGLSAVWFGAGALAALLAAALSAPLWLQLVLFVAVSALSLALIRPLLVDRLAPRRSATSFDRVMDMVGIVTEDIDNVAGSGKVKVDGKLWTARSYDGQPIPAGSHVEPRYIEGVKLIVSPIHSTAAVSE